MLLKAIAIGTMIGVTAGVFAHKTPCHWLGWAMLILTSTIWLCTYRRRNKPSDRALLLAQFVFATVSFTVPFLHLG